MSSQTNRLAADRRQPEKNALGPPLFLATTLLGGCAGHGAPSFVLVGAFFPAWMLCAFIGILGAIAARGVFVVSGLDNVLPFQLFVSTSIGVVVGTLTWLIWFGR